MGEREAIPFGHPKLHYFFKTFNVLPSNFTMMMDYQRASQCVGAAGRAFAQGDFPPSLIESFLVDYDGK